MVTELAEPIDTRYAETPLVSVVIVTWNRKDDVLITLRSVQEQRYRNIETIVVDNGSNDGTIEAVRKAYPQVRLIVLEDNLGATGGRNRGIAACNGHIIFLLDSDASLTPDALARIVDRFEEDPDIGVITCKVLSSSTGEIDPIAWLFTENNKADQDSEFFSYSFSEGAAALRQEVLKQTGLFWDYIHYGREGEELGLRVWDAGYQILYFPEAIVYHRVSARHRVTDERQLYFDLRNSLSLYIVHYRWWMLAHRLPFKLITSLAKGIMHNQPKTIARAILDSVRNLTMLLKKRKPISRETARRYMKMQREHGPLGWDLISWLRRSRLSVR